MLMFMCRIC